MAILHLWDRLRHIFQELGRNGHDYLPRIRITLFYGGELTWITAESTLELAIVLVGLQIRAANGLARFGWTLAGPGFRSTKTACFTA